MRQRGPGGNQVFSVARSKHIAMLKSTEVSLCRHVVSIHCIHRSLHNRLFHKTCHILTTCSVKTCSALEFKINALQRHKQVHFTKRKL
jgi:hypothetical protein